MNAQEFIIGHLVPIAATTAVLWLVYRLLFRNSNRLYFNRYFLLSSMLLALAMPLLGLISGTQAPQMAVLKQNMFGGGTMLNEVIVTPDGQPMLPEVTVTTSTQSHFSLWQVIGGLYIIGVAVMALLFLIKLGKLVVLIARSPKRKMSSCTAVFTGREQGSFSFFRYAIFPNENVDPDIMRHEISHIEHHHSWDILFAELMMILQWFNPFIYLYKKELQSLHEYQADRDVVATGVNKKNYMMLILQQCTAADFSGMSNNFSLILTKKRIKMITRNEKAKGLWWRLLATLPVLAILLIANTKVTAQEQMINPNPPVDADTYQIVMYEYDDSDRVPINDTVIYNEDGSYTEIKREREKDPETGGMRTKVCLSAYDKDGNPTTGFHIKTEPNHGDTSVYHITPIEGFHFPAEVIDNDTIYQVVDQKPEFPGGMEAMMQYIVDNIKYPQDAINEGKSGRVFVSFVVEKDGSISNVKVMKGICESIDKEAVRVVSSMPRWYAGMHKGEPVRVSYTLPIKFQARDLTGDGETDAAMVRMEDKDGHSYHIDKSVETDKTKMKPDKNGVYSIVDEMPKFPDGEQAMMKYLADNIKYPKKAKDNNIEGRVFVNFVVEKDGSISEVKVLRGIGGGCDEEAVRVISAMPKWKPGKQEGKPVRVYYTIPIFFKLGNSTEKGSSLVGSIWEGTGTGTKNGVTYTWHSIMQFTSENEGFFIEKLTSQKKNEKPEVVFENVAMNFEYAFDGKKTGAITPKNGDGTYMDELPPEGFVLSEDGKTIVFHFYTAKEDTGIEYVTYKRK